jgi:hypothetical protein
MKSNRRYARYVQKNSSPNCNEQYEVVPRQLSKLGVFNNLFHDHNAADLPLAEDLERVERLGLSNVERESLASDGPGAAVVGLVRRRAHASDTVAAEERRHAGAGTRHVQVERATAREGDAGRAGGAADGLDDGAGGAAGGRVVRGDAVGPRGVRDGDGGEDGGSEGCGELHFLIGSAQRKCRCVSMGPTGL